MMRLIRLRGTLKREYEKSGRATSTKQPTATTSTPAQPGVNDRIHGVGHGLLVLTAGLLTAVQLDTVDRRRLHEFLSVQQCLSVTSCDAYLHEFDEEHPAGHSERERFLNGLEYHRSLLFDYVRRWNDTTESSNSKVHNSIVWPRNVPTADEIPALELDLRFCRMSPNYRNNAADCQNLQFRIASFYVTQQDDSDLQRHGFKLLKDVAIHGQPDAMCLYAIILNDGRLPGLEANPEEAVVWWRRCVDLHRHITATYELAVAYYTGEGCAENPDYSVRLFRQAAHLGHAGAAYMLGECLLDGVGVTRDRGAALEWLVTAAELGHGLARERVIIVLNEDYESMDAGLVEANREEEAKEARKWAANHAGENPTNLERRFTIRSAPDELGRRKTKVLESRDKD